jgi:hypothetical protein
VAQLFVNCNKQPLKGGLLLLGKMAKSVCDGGMNLWDGAQGTVFYVSSRPFAFLVVNLKGVEQFYKRAKFTLFN